MRTIACLMLATVLLLPSASFGQMIDNTHDRVQTTLDPGLKRIGTVMPRTAGEVGRSNIAIGCEMLPRGYGDFEAFKQYIAPLGVKRIRLHAGWAKIEPQRGVYQFDWLDKQVSYLVEQGMDVLLETSYGNPIYPGGGGASLADGLPHGEEGLAAWDRYVDALAAHYTFIKDWSCWNEPNIGTGNSPEQVADNNIRTAEIIRKHIPDARIAGLVIGAPNARFAAQYMNVLKQRGRTDLFEWMIYHDYRVNPDECYPQVAEFVKAVRDVAPGMKIWQGEAGATSAPHYSHAISSGQWNSELTQCKWNARRVIGDLGHDLETLLFTFYDPAYDQPERYTRFVDPIWIRTRTDRFMKRMGLIKCNEDLKVLKVKPAYYTVQHLASIFDASIETFSDAETAVDCAKETVVYPFRQKETGHPILAYWDCSSHPENDNTATVGQLTVRGMQFAEPVWVDIVTGAIYAIPAERIVSEDGATTFKDMPVYDAPALIVEQALLDSSLNRDSAR